MTPQENKLLKSAIWYCNQGFSVFPLIPGKKVPHKDFDVAEGPFKEKPSLEQVTTWWSKEFKGSNIAIATGEISGISVFDLDIYKMDKEQLRTTRDLFWDIETPIATSPSGGRHYYFAYNSEVISKAGALVGHEFVDSKSDGGYIVAPPSQNGNGKSYAWLSGSKITDVELVAIEHNILSLYNTAYISSLSLNCENHAKSLNSNGKATLSNRSNMINFSQGNRDQALFHLANHLVKSGMPTQEVEQYLLFVSSHCDPPFSEKEAQIKIKSALKRDEIKDRSMTSDLREFIESNMGATIKLQDGYNMQHLQHADEKKKMRSVFSRFAKEGLLERTGKAAGEYKIINTDIQEQDWKNTEDSKFPITLPLGMHEAIRIRRNSIICFAGENNSGKSAFCINICAVNHSRQPIYYFSSEIEAGDFKGRAEKHDENWRDWDVHLLDGSDPESLPSAIKPQGFNIIDYLEPPQGEYYKMAGLLTDIHRRLKGGIAIVCIQKKSGAEGGGAGGQYMKNKTHLYCNLEVKDYPVCRMTIEKCKATNDDYKNPQFKWVEYKIERDGVSVIPFGKLEFERWG